MSELEELKLAYAECSRQRNELLNKLKSQAQQESVGYVAENGVVDWNICAPPIMTDLYTSPPQRKPLTDEEIILIVADCASSHQHTDIHFARAIEAKLKEKNNG